MRRLFFIILILPFCLQVKGQSFSDSILRFREQYVKELLEDARAPVKPAQTKSLSFYTPDSDYRVWADFTATPGAEPFLIQTHSGKQKPYREYGVLKFRLKGETYSLHIYQGMDLIKDEAHKDYLFIPFNDETNYVTTFGGGRYIDLSTGDIKNGRVVLDFNKCYNPYCAYAEGYSCPIPPTENHLATEIEAGEKLFRE